MSVRTFPEKINKEERASSNYETISLFGDPDEVKGKRRKPTSMGGLSLCFLTTMK